MSVPLRRHTMQGRQGAADFAARLVGTWLQGQAGIDGVDDVQGDPRWQREDVDLLVRGARWPRPQAYEVKGDALGHTSGNVFLETISNEQRGTPGCLLYSSADMLAYTFVESARVLLVPMPAIRRWLLQHAETAPLIGTSTTGPRGTYRTFGRVVAIERLLHPRDGLGGEAHLVRVERTWRQLRGGATPAPQAAQGRVVRGGQVADRAAIEALEDDLRLACETGRLTGQGHESPLGLRAIARSAGVRR